MSEIPGLIVHIEGEWMNVRVPTGAGCTSCAGKSECSFLGPASAYRTLHLPREEWCTMGQRVRVDEPPTTLAPAALALVALPLALIVLGRALLECCVHFRFATATVWLLGFGVWIAALYGTNRWMGRASLFRATIRPA